MNKLSIIFVLLALTVSLRANSQKNPKAAISGYDPVSYFTDKPTKGNAQFTSTFEKSNYYFSSLENKTIFDKNPSKYSPKYGGWCAYAMGLDGSKVTVNPMSYKFIDGELYLFYKTAFVDTKQNWNKNEQTLRKNADKNWATLP